MMNFKGGIIPPVVFALLVTIFSYKIEPCYTSGIDFGGVVRGEKTIYPGEPVNVKTDIIVEPDSTLIIKPGAELRFAPGMGITVSPLGTLIANGFPERKINFTRMSHSELHWTEHEELGPLWPDVRLVDGDSILQGRLQMFYKGKWRSVCTNSKNWTESDLHVMCRQLGFTGGLLYRWFPRSNDSSQLLYEEPNCFGNETTLSACPSWEDRQLGSGVCDYHEDIGIQCEKNLGNHRDLFWRGLHFNFAKSKQESPVVNKIIRRISYSVLQHVNIYFAGSDHRGNATPAIFVTGIPPQMSHIDVRWSAFDAIHFDKPSELFNFNNSQISENRGYGIFINSSVGQATLESLTIRENGGDGVRYVYHESFISDLSFCETGNIGYGQTYPVRRSLVQQKGHYMRACEQVFQVDSRTGQLLTVHFLGLASDSAEEGTTGFIEVYDGPTDSSRRLAHIPVMNDTTPQSVTSSRPKILLRYIPSNEKNYVTFTIEIVANEGRAYDLNVTNCNITKNNGKGVFLEDQRSGVLVNRSILAENTHVAGLHVAGGTGDLVVNNTYITSNEGDGINTTSSGGFMHIDRTSIGNNTGRGISFWFNETSTSVASNHSVHISRSEVVYNGLYGILIGNQCRSDSLCNISLNSFRSNFDTAVHFLSCWETGSHVKNATFLLTHNQFLNSRHLAVELLPALNMRALVEHNEFSGHERGVLLFGATDEEKFSEVPVEIEIRFNHFTVNSGAFVVNIGLVQESSVQKLHFSKNRLEQNTVREKFPNLKPRSRVAGVVVVSSENAIVYRNFFNNPDSRYQLGSHLERHDLIINATFNFWGTRSAAPVAVYDEIFDRKDRYNLAMVEFLPFLLYGSDLDTNRDISDTHQRDKIIPFRNEANIGGEVSGEEILEPKEYNVLRDIFVRPGGRLNILPGATLKFSESIGMMVQGELQSGVDSDSKPITYTINKGSGGRISSKIRLSNGTEGRLEVSMDGLWGSVCRYGWDMINAAIACHQMGLVLHPEDWVLEQSQFQHSANPKFLISNVQCTLLDTDITLCRSEREFENSCPEEVGLRCYKNSWSGLRLGMSAKESKLRNVVIEQAGLLDYSTNSFKPALQIDFNRHHLEKVTVRDNMDSGVGIMWNEMFLSESRQILESDFRSNRKHGLEIHAQGVDISQCTTADNAASGIHYNPMFKRTEQKDLMTWVNLKDRSKVIVIPDDVRESIFIPQGERRFLVFSKRKEAAKFILRTDNGRKLGIMVLNPLGQSSTEQMVLYGRLILPNTDEMVDTWNLRKNLTSFPLRTPGYGVSVKYNPGENPSAAGILYITSVEGPKIRNGPESPPSLRIDSVTIQGCGRGFSSHHYNRDVSSSGDHFHRYSNETILITNTTITGSKAEAVFVWTPFWDTEQSTLAEVNYTIINSTIKRNSRGLLHYSRDIRNSNNLFHWTINETSIFENSDGGIDIRLPYVWQYSENFTHSFSMHKSRLFHNHEFEFSLGGHFARVNMSENSFHNNTCKRGVIQISGMEKELLIEDNTIAGNLVQFAVEFNLQSHADKFGLVSAAFRRNTVNYNRDKGSAKENDYQPTSYAISVRGVQPVNITRNLFENPNLQFELLAGVLTGSINYTINVGKNWWGNVSVIAIQKRIFDFDDWNGFAVADFNPYLGSRNIYGGTLEVRVEDRPFILDEPLGGRIFDHLTLPYRDRPYEVSSDLTVMPNAVLTLHPGVVMEFHPSVGILVLGDLVAQGRANRPIIMKPVRMESWDRFRRQVTHLRSRLCVSEKCDTRRNDGFLEIYNVTTEQWVPVCDARFTERNAQVVCAELGYSPLNVHIKRGPRLDLGPTQVGRIRSWPHPLECVGNENSLLECEYRLNGYVENYQCPYSEDFVYVLCGIDALVSEDEDHWGGIRFSIPSFEYPYSQFNRPTVAYSPFPTSKLEYVNIFGAGVLHGEKSGAVQLVHREVQINNVNITRSASNGIEVIAVPRSMSFNELLVENNLGVGISFLSLTGESSDSQTLSYDPLQKVDLPYGVFGMVDICDTNKEMYIKDRIILFYKYDNQPVDCVKIFSSSHHTKQVGFRLLQFNLFNGSDYSSQPDVIRIYDGDIFNQSTRFPYEIGWQFGIETATKFYTSSLSTLSVQLHTIGGSGEKGFIAEVVTLPISHPIARETQHNVSYSKISNNGLEGVTYRGAGEITPTLTLRFNRIEDNGQELFGNFTAGDGAVLLDIQNAQNLYFYNNLVIKNQGGLHLRVDSFTSVSSLRGLIVNNLFTENQNRETLMAHGRKSGAFQFVDVYRNYFTRNNAKFRDNMVFSQVLSNLTENMAYNNTGKHLLDVQGFPKMSQSYQTCQRNWFWKNAATDIWDRSTIIASNAGQRFNHNYLVNPDNDFELAAMNRSMPEVEGRSIDALNNWWGFNGSAAVAGRVKDYSDQEELLEVKYWPFLSDNTTVLDGKCAGGWTKIGDTCFLYVGGIMNFSEAKRFCELDNASMPYVKTKHDKLMAFVEQQQFYYNRYTDQVWIQSIDIPLRQCAVLINRRVKPRPCEEYHPFLCERDPEITVSTSVWFLEPLTIIFICVTLLGLFLVFLCVGFWFCKSRQRYQEKLERRNSIRASIRSNRSLTGGFSELGYKRRIERVLESGGGGGGPAPASKMMPELRMNGSVDSIEKTPSRFSCSMDDSYDHTPVDTSTRVMNNSDYSDFVDRFRRDPQLENANVNMMVHPTFDLTYENQGYADRSMSRNSHEISRDWSTASGSTLDMKRSLDSKDEPYQNGAYRNSPSPQAPSSRETNSRDGASSGSSSRLPPLETAM